MSARSCDVGTAECSSGTGAGHFPPLLVDGQRLALADVARIAFAPIGRGFEIPQEALRRMAESVRCKDVLVASGTAIYGVTTGFGDSSSRQVDPRRSEEMQRNLLRFLRVGVGPDAPDDVVRATMLIRANCAARGNSGIRAEPIELLLDLLALDILPVIPERGSVGASGDLAPLSYVAAALVGEGEVRHQGRRMSTAEALRAHALRPVALQSKEGLALVNGTSFMAAYLALAFAEATELIWIAELCTALATETRLSTDRQFADFPHRHKPHPGQIDSAAHIHRMLAGSGLTNSETEKVAADNKLGYVELSRGVQDPYSIRCAPHVIGVLRDTAHWVENWLNIEINSSNDNPLFDATSGEVFNSGNFYGGHIAQAAQSLAAATASVADLLDRQLQLLVDEKFNLGLPPNLIPPLPVDHASAGLHHGFKGAQIAASALTAEALHLTTPAASFSRSTESHNQDKVSMGTIAARHARTTGGLALDVAAIHLLALCQAADLRDADRLGPITGAVHAHVRKQIAFLDQDRPMDGDIEAIGAMIRRGELRHVGEPAPVPHQNQAT